VKDVLKIKELFPRWITAPIQLAYFLSMMDDFPFGCYIDDCGMAKITLNLPSSSGNLASYEIEPTWLIDTFPKLEKGIFLEILEKCLGSYLKNQMEVIKKECTGFRMVNHEQINNYNIITPERILGIIKDYNRINRIPKFKDYLHESFGL